MTPANLTPFIISLLLAYHSALVYVYKTKYIHLSFSTIPVTCIYLGHRLFPNSPGFIRFNGVASGQRTTIGVLLFPISALTIMVHRHGRPSRDHLKLLKLAPNAMIVQPDFAALKNLVVGAGTLYVLTRILQAWHVRYKLRHIPSVGTSAPLLSYLGGMRFFRHAPEMLHEGYQKYRGGLFKIPLTTGWVVVVTGRDRVDELRKAPDDVASLQEAVNETIQLKYTFGEECISDTYHLDTIRNPLTRNIATRFEDIQDEIASAFATFMPATEEWSPVRALSALMNITCRTSNRFFVGLPLCRYPDFIRLNIAFTSEVVKTGKTLSTFPELLRPIGALIMTSVSKSIDQGLQHLQPILEERLEKDAKYGPKWEGRPNDLISWLLDTESKRNKTVRGLTMRILVVNFAAIHTTSMTFTQVLFDLANHPEYIPALREEIEEIVNEEGVTKASLLKMVKLDSFVKESQRIGGIAALTVQRMLLKDLTFSDGLTIPKGTFVAVPSMEVQRDNGVYDDATQFDGFRYAKMAKDTDTYNKHSMVALSTDFLIFGHGRHACPGRFFAVNEVKAFLVHVLMNYDIMLDPNSPPLKHFWVNSSTFPDPSATIMVRKRKV